ISRLLHPRPARDARGPDGDAERVVTKATDCTDHTERDQNRFRVFHVIRGLLRSASRGALMRGRPAGFRPPVYNPDRKPREGLGMTPRKNALVWRLVIPVAIAILPLTLAAQNG